jgi:2-polyprenyl-6-methoxyphenol hydroxylase-like FAD-dependent oxidoreductase
MTMERVLVVGGGIAGLGAAAALRQRGVPAVVHERRPTWPDGGLGLNLPGNAVVALQALGLGEALDGMGAPVRRREYRNHRGRLWFAVDEDAFWGPAAGPRCVIRSELHDALRSLLAREDLRLGADVRDVRVLDDGVELEPATGQVERGGALIGADGVRSTIRGLVSGDHSPQAALLSSASWRFVTRNPGVDCWVAWTGPAGTALLIPVGGDRVYGWVSMRQETKDFGRVLAAFAGYPRPVPDALAAAGEEAVPPHLSPLEEVRPAAWTPGRVVLIGDAAHATAPVWAQGAALAVEDGLALADLLSTDPDWAGAGAAFERRRRARVEHVQHMTDRLSRSAGLPPWLREVLLPVIGPRTYRATYGPLRDS